MRGMVCLAVLSSACASVEPASGSERYGPVKGESLISLGGSIADKSFDDSELNDVKTTEVTLMVSYGYFLSTNNEIGAEVLYGLVDSNIEDTDVNKIDATAFYNYNFRVSSRTWLYVGADLGLTYLDDELLDISSTEPAYGAHVGARFWATPQTSVFIEPYYRRNDNVETQAGSLDQDTFAILFGVEFALRSSS